MKLGQLDVLVTRYFYSTPQPKRLGMVRLGDGAWELYMGPIYIVISKTIIAKAPRPIAGKTWREVNNECLNSSTNNCIGCPDCL